MSQNNYYSVKSSVDLKFRNSEICEISYNSFLPEVNKLKTTRSKISIEKKNDTLSFNIESTDITAFRATMSDIIGLGKIIESTLDIYMEI